MGCVIWRRHPCPLFIHLFLQHLFSHQSLPWFVWYLIIFLLDFCNWLLTHPYPWSNILYFVAMMASLNTPLTIILIPFVRELQVWGERVKDFGFLRTQEGSLPRLFAGWWLLALCPPWAISPEGTPVLHPSLLVRPWSLDQSHGLSTNPLSLPPGPWPPVVLAAAFWFIREVVVLNGEKKGLWDQTDLDLNSGLDHAWVIWVVSWIRARTLQPNCLSLNPDLLCSLTRANYLTSLCSFPISKIRIIIVSTL